MELAQIYGSDIMGESINTSTNQATLDARSHMFLNVDLL